MKDWRSWAWLSVAIIIVSMSTCTTIQIKYEAETSIKAMEKGYEIRSSGFKIKFEGEE